MDLSIIILSYRSKDDLQRLLPSIFASKNIVFNTPTIPSPVGVTPPSEGGELQTAVAETQLSSSSRRSTRIAGEVVGVKRYSAEVIVVDNGSPDGTYDWLSLNANRYPLTAIKNINNGFAKGNNLGIKRAQGKYILLLNPDTTVEPDTFKAMLDFMESRPDVGMATCKLVKPDGTLDRAARRNFPNPWNAMLRFLHLQKLSSKPYNFSDDTQNQEMEIDSLVGAFCLTRRSVLDEIGLLDEAFFMYGEDIDWCWRCKEAGYKVWYYPKTKITHFKGESSKKIAFKALKWFHDAMWIFYRKHYMRRYPFWFNWLVWLGVYGRLGFLSLVNAVKKNPRVSG